MTDKNGRGRFYHRVAWDLRADADDGYGNTVTDWTEQFQTRAGFTFLRGSEAVIAARLEGRQPVIVRVRVSSRTRQITTDWRMRDARSGEIYAVRSIIETDDRAYRDITVERGVTA